MLSAFIGRLQKLYHTSPNNLLVESIKRGEKKNRLSLQNKINVQDQHVSNPLTLHTNLHFC